MSTAQHTPGPWIHDPEDNIISTDASPYAKLIEWQPRSLHVSVVERNANGRLIAAAPELLAACQMFMYSVAHSEIRGEPGSMLETMRAAIAKATGSAA